MTGKSCCLFVHSGYLCLLPAFLHCYCVVEVVAAVLDLSADNHLHQLYSMDLRREGCKCPRRLPELRRTRIHTVATSCQPVFTVPYVTSCVQFYYFGFKNKVCIGRSFIVLNKSRGTASAMDDLFSVFGNATETTEAVPPVATIKTSGKPQKRNASRIIATPVAKKTKTQPMFACMLH